MLTKGHADAVIELGGELWKLGNEQVEQSDDEGGMAMSILEYLEIVFQALPANKANKYSHP